MGKSYFAKLRGEDLKKAEDLLSKFDAYESMDECEHNYKYIGQTDDKKCIKCGAMIIT